MNIYVSRMYRNTSPICFSVIYLKTIGGAYISFRIRHKVHEGIDAPMNDSFKFKPYQVCKSFLHRMIENAGGGNCVLKDAT